MNISIAAALFAALVSAPPPQGITKHDDPTWTLRATTYCPHGPGQRGRIHGHWADGPGGGATAGWTGQILYNYHCAVDPHIVPLGTKLWVAKPFNRLVIAVDTGPDIQGHRIDMCFVNARDFLDHGNIDQRVRVWKVGKLTRAQARRWKPEAR